ncbi:MAG: SRPBCC family protein [Anaerolineae bacterium]|nr:SRPBCC family protein [Anaerolineae bacterium]
MSQMKHSTHSVTLNVPYDKAFDYLSDWRNQPQWAINFVKGIRQEGEQIIMTTPFGDRPIQWRTNRDLGTIDIVFPGESVLPTRLTAIGDSLVYTFTFSVPANLPDEEFRAGQHGMDEELQTLKRILEG